MKSLKQPVDWKHELLLNSRDAPQAVLANAIIAIRRAPEWAGVVGHDIFSNQTVALRPPPWSVDDSAWSTRAWSDRDDILATDWLQHQGISVGVEATHRAIEAAAMDNEFHPIHDYLDSIEWDGQQRIENWMCQYLGARPSPYLKAISRCTLIAAVARVKRPGCKVDTVPIIEGHQGIRKSSAIRTLGGQWFTDEISEFGSKDAAMQAASAWFIEIAELDAMSKAETSKVKAFISRTTDRYRPPFGRRIIESKRPSVFWGTTNSDAYLKDETGGRRFWPIKAGAIDIDALARDRDQLFAEAVVLFRNGTPWWINESEIEGAARTEQKARYLEDAWYTAVASYVEHRDDVSVHEVLAQVLNKSIGDSDQRAQNRVVSCLKHLDFERYRKRVPGRARLEWRYRRRFNGLEEIRDA